MMWFRRKKDENTQPDITEDGQASASDIDLPPLSQERLIDIFRKEEWLFEIDEDNDLGARWDRCVFFFILTGKEKEILHISARIVDRIPEEFLPEVALFIEDWNRDRLWPKVYLRGGSSTDTYVHGELNVDYEHGVSREQLKQQINCAIGTMLQLQSELTKSFGSWAPPEEEEE